MTQRGRIILLNGVSSSGKSTLGLGRRQLGYTHDGMVYDVEVDTFHYSREECAARILQAVARLSCDRGATQER